MPKKVQSLRKIKTIVEDETGIKQVLYKVVAVCKDGSMRVFSPGD